MKVNPKRISLIVSVIISSTLLWAVARGWLNAPERFSDLMTMFWPALVLVCASAVTGVAFLLMEHKADRLAAIFASWAAFIFFWQPNVWYISALPLFAGFWLAASYEIRNDLADRRKLRIGASIGQGMKTIFLGSFVMISLGFYLLPSSQNTTLNQISKNVQRSVENSYDNPIVRDQLDQLPPSSQTEFRQEVAQYIDQSVKTWLGPIKEFIPPILAFGLFLALWSLNFLFRPFAVWVGVQLFRLLELTGFVRVEEEGVKAEVIKIS